MFKLHKGPVLYKAAHSGYRPYFKGPQVRVKELQCITIQNGLLGENRVKSHI
jgi:hypothetical protein